MVKLALAIYDNRTFDRLPHSADMLKIVGGDNAGSPAHCQGTGPHVREDIVTTSLGKE